MRKIYSLAVLLFFAVLSNAQVTTQPAIITKGYQGEIIITFDPAQGNGGMVGATQCYAHTGLITSKSSNNSDWKYASKWRGGEDKYKMTKVGNNWQLVIPNIYTYYGCPESEDIRKLAFVFNDGPAGTKEGKTSAGTDIFVELIDPTELRVSLSPQTDQVLKSLNQSVTFEGISTIEANLTLKLDGQVVATAAGATQIKYTQTFTQYGLFEMMLEAEANGKTLTAKTYVAVVGETKEVARPEGLQLGITYPTEKSATFCLYAGSKTQPAQSVFLVGDFNDWHVNPAYQMYRDGFYFWLTIDGLTQGEEYAFQYKVTRADGVVKHLSDPYSTKVLHPDDQWEPKALHPELKDYPSAPEADRGYVTVINTKPEQFLWSDATLNFKRPDKNNLVIYEVWIYDHTPERSIAALTERLDYIEALGVNAVELMPICEFDGNLNWGYSPNHYFAPDRAYGSEWEYKAFIDECHKRGIAVILDMVFNHATGLNPQNKLYPYGTDLANNPYFNVKAPHSDNVYEDWNHDFPQTHEMFIRALKYWIQEYHVDGYRMDLSHGLCGASNNSVENLKDYYHNGVLAADPEAATKPYFILEHWGSNMGSERPQLVNEGMMCWQNTCTSYEQTAMGWLGQSEEDSFAAANMDGYVSYCNNHDEERPFFKAKQWGAGSMQGEAGEAERCARVPLNMAFLCLLNGPQLFYHYDEIGYDFSKWQDRDGRWGTNPYNIKAYEDKEYKMNVKVRPEGMGWFKSEPRMKAYQKTAQIIQLRTRLLPNVFAGNPTAQSIGKGVKMRTIQWDNEVFVAGNFSATEAQQVTLPVGTWYDYLAGGTLAAGNYTLQPGEVKVFTGRQLAPPAVPDHFDYVVDGLPTTTFEAVNTTAYKMLIDGRIVIVRDGHKYDILGRRIE